MRKRQGASRLPSLRSALPGLDPRNHSRVLGNYRSDLEFSDRVDTEHRQGLLTTWGNRRTPERLVSKMVLTRAIEFA
jgi:hypothetical protein